MKRLVKILTGLICFGIVSAYVPALFDVWFETHIDKYFYFGQGFLYLSILIVVLSLQ